MATVSREVPSTATPVRSAAVEETERVVATLVLAFSEDPFIRYWLPEPPRFLSYFPEVIRAFGGRGFAHGSAHCTEDYRGAALWLPPGVHPDNHALARLFQRTLSEDRLPELFDVMQQMERWQPTEPHWYLPLLGVDPGHRGKGFGSALLRHALDRCERENTIAYLEATSPRNIPLYERHGFEVLGTIRSGMSPPLIPMLRRPACEALR